MEAVVRKIRKEDVKKFVANKLATDRVWAKQALLRIYEFQTADEKDVEHTIDHNGVGFSGFDGEILSSFARQVLEGKTLSERQMELLMKRIPRYAKQIVSISDETKLLKLIK